MFSAVAIAFDRSRSRPRRTATLPSEDPEDRGGRSASATIAAEHCHIQHFRSVIVMKHERPLKVTRSHESQH
jgi:hypothetical protein